MIVVVMVVIVVVVSVVGESCGDGGGDVIDGSKTGGRKYKISIRCFA